MSNANEAIKAARGSHRLGFLVTFTALAMLLAPFPIDYSRPLQEAYVLRDLQLSDYERYIKTGLESNTLLPHSKDMIPGNWEEEIIGFLQTHLTSNSATKRKWLIRKGDFPNPDWSVDPIVAYEKPPTNGTMEKWLEWMQSSKPAKYYVPDWNTASFSMSRNYPGKPPIIRHFSVSKSETGRHPGEYIFRAYGEISVLQNEPKTRPERNNWWVELGLKSRRDLFEDGKKSALLDENKFIIEGEVDSGLREIRYGGAGVKQWLIASGNWDNLSMVTELGETVFPGLREKWSEVRNQPLNEAINYMEEKQRKIQDVSLFGISVSGQLFIVAIPFAYLVLFSHLFIHLRYIKRIQLRKGLDSIAEAPWMGLYNDRVAQ